jgi:hypothetical protein
MGFSWFNKDFYTPSNDKSRVWLMYSLCRFLPILVIAEVNASLNG